MNSHPKDGNTEIPYVEAFLKELKLETKILIDSYNQIVSEKQQIEFSLHKLKERPVAPDKLASFHHRLKELQDMLQTEIISKKIEVNKEKISELEKSIHGREIDFSKPYNYIDSVNQHGLRKRKLGALEKDPSSSPPASPKKGNLL